MDFDYEDDGFGDCKCICQGVFNMKFTPLTSSHLLMFPIVVEEKDSKDNGGSFFPPVNKDNNSKMSNHKDDFPKAGGGINKKDDFKLPGAEEEDDGWGGFDDVAGTAAKKKDPTPKNNFGSGNDNPFISKDKKKSEGGGFDFGFGDSNGSDNKLPGLNKNESKKSLANKNKEDGGYSDDDFNDFDLPNVKDKKPKESFDFNPKPTEEKSKAVKKDGFDFGDSNEKSKEKSGGGFDFGFDDSKESNQFKPGLDDTNKKADAIFNDEKNKKHKRDDSQNTWEMESAKSKKMEEKVRGRQSTRNKSSRDNLSRGAMNKSSSGKDLFGAKDKPVSKQPSDDFSRADNNDNAYNRDREIIQSKEQPFTTKTEPHHKKPEIKESP